MKPQEAYALQAGNQVHHRDYGFCTVEKIVPEFGVVLQPNGRRGRRMLAGDSGAALGTPLLEDNAKLLRHLPAATLAVQRSLPC